MQLKLLKYFSYQFSRFYHGFLNENKLSLSQLRTISKSCFLVFLSGLQCLFTAQNSTGAFY